ncbi:MAG: hypothetical protein OES09_03800 [Gammaproteobacteria bacterium]|nr:hypothetical protein [Gammaproteobacteria bacterium]
MLHTYREMLDDWQSMQRHFWANPWLGNIKMDDSVFSMLNPWAKSLIDQTMGLQYEWWKKWQEATGLADQLPSMYASTLQEASESWVKAQSQVWNAWIGMYQSSTNSAAATPARKTPAKPPVKSVVTPELVKPQAKPKQLQLDARDDLKEISGIGPALEKKLNAEGVVSFRQIAGLKKSDIARLEETVIKFPGRIERDDWIGQAKKLAKG